MQKQKVKKAIGLAIMLVAIPLLIVLGVWLFEDRKYNVISMVIALLSCVPFFIRFEKGKNGAREVVVIAVMTAFSVIGRLAFSPIPAFKPVTAITIIAGIALGAESGFMVGSLTAIVSNIFFGQGPWTPFQMLGWGLIGLIAGYLERPLRRHRVLLLLYGVAAGIFFSLLMDIFTALWYHSSFTIAAYLAVMATALPHTLLYACSNFIFLWYMAKPIGDKLNRLKLKYGI